MLHDISATEMDFVNICMEFGGGRRNVFDSSVLLYLVVWISFCVETRCFTRAHRSWRNRETTGEITRVATPTRTEGSTDCIDVGSSASLWFGTTSSNWTFAAYLISSLCGSLGPLWIWGWQKREWSSLEWIASLSCIRRWSLGDATCPGAYPNFTLSESRRIETKITHTWDRQRCMIYRQREFRVFHPVLVEKDGTTCFRLSVDFFVVVVPACLFIPRCWENVNGDDDESSRWNSTLLWRLISSSLFFSLSFSSVDMMELRWRGGQGIGGLLLQFVCSDVIWIA